MSLQHHALSLEHQYRAKLTLQNCPVYEEPSQIAGFQYHLTELQRGKGKILFTFRWTCLLCSISWSQGVSNWACSQQWGHLTIQIKGFKWVETCGVVQENISEHGNQSRAALKSQVPVLFCCRMKLQDTREKMKNQLTDSSQPTTLLPRKSADSSSSASWVQYLSLRK